MKLVIVIMLGLLLIYLTFIVIMYIVLRFRISKYQERIQYLSGIISGWDKEIFMDEGRDNNGV